jgi:ATP-dependent DNA ligase
MLEANVWFEPVVVIEILGAEITSSPIHVCAKDVIRKGSGLAIRFPRFAGTIGLTRQLKMQQQLRKSSKCIRVN